MIAAASNGHHVGQPGGNIDLPAGIFAPRRYRPVGLQRQAVVTSRRDARDRVQVGRQIRLAGAVVSPRDNPPIIS